MIAVSKLSNKVKVILSFINSLRMRPQDGLKILRLIALSSHFNKHQKNFAQFQHLEILKPNFL